MHFGETPKNLSRQERVRLNKLADELDTLRQAAAKRLGLKTDAISYVNWIVQDLRKGDIKAARVNYEQQSDKYGSIPEIKQFLIDSGVAKEIDWKELSREEEERRSLFEQSKKNLSSIKEKMKQKGFDYASFEVLTKTVFKDEHSQAISNKTKDEIIEEYKARYPFEFEIELIDAEGLKDNQQAVYVFTKTLKK